MTTREEWLDKAALNLSNTLFSSKGYTVPKIRISIGFTGTRSSKAIGACWSAKASDDLIAQIFITPTSSDSIAILATLVHEMIHATIGNDQGHGPLFKRAAIAVGLEGKMTATKAGAALVKVLEVLVKEIGEIPHAKLNLAMNPKKKQGTRLIKVSCSETEYSVRITRKWLDEQGAPICPCCSSPMKEGEE